MVETMATAAVPQPLMHDLGSCRLSAEDPHTGMTLPCASVREWRLSRCLELVRVVAGTGVDGEPKPLRRYGWFFV